MNSNYKKIYSLVALFTIFTLVVIRLIDFIIDFGQNSLQMDFSAYYTAGESLNFGISPYQNQIAYHPPIWDGIAIFRHSRFLYPPMAATLFQPLALLPYWVAKYVWMFITLICAIVVLVITATVFKLKITIETFLILAISLCLYYPLLTHLERGQVDLLVLVLLTFAIQKMSINDQSGLCGILLSLATLLKLHCVFLVPFLLLRRKWPTLVGYFVGGFLIVFFTTAIHGPDALHDYLYRQLPRISAFGEGGTPEMLLEDSAHPFQDVLAAIPDDATIKDGIIYSKERLSITANGTIVRPARNLLSRYGIDVSISALSLGTFLCFFALLWLWQLRYKERFSYLSPAHEFTYWQIILIIVLLCSPLTGAMNTVWLIPIIYMLIYWASILNVTEKRSLYFFILGIIGMVIAAFPDNWLLILAHGNRIVDHKYLVAEIVLLVSLLYFWGNCSGRSPDRACQSARSGNRPQLEGLSSYENCSVAFPTGARQTGKFAQHL